jgi:hypothetical protein
MVSLVKAANSKKGRSLHRWIGIIVAVYVVMAALSGILHIVMTNFFTAPPPVIPQGVMRLEQAALPLSEIVKHLPNPKAAVKGVNIRTINDNLWYQFIIEGETKPVYIHAVTGKSDAGMDEAYAQDIASKYLRKDRSVVHKTDYLTAFNKEYLNIFRALPVYRFDADHSNGEHVYVSTITGSVTLYLNTPRALIQSSFSNLHKLAFISNHVVRDIVQAALVIGITITTFIGVGIFFSRIIKRKAE